MKIHTQTLYWLKHPKTNKPRTNAELIGFKLEKTKEEISKYLRYINQESVGDIDFREFNLSKYRAKNMTDDLVKQYLNESENKTHIPRKGL